MQTNPSISLRDLLPHDGVFTRLVLGLPLHTQHLHAASVEGRRNADFDLLGQQGRLEVGFENDLKFEAK